jgi:hypothetical protein
METERPPWCYCDDPLVCFCEQDEDPGVRPDYYDVVELQYFTSAW